MVSVPILRAGDVKLEIIRACHVKFSYDPIGGTSLERKDEHFRLSLNLVAEFKPLASILGFSEAQAAETALQEWVNRNQK